MGLQWTYREEGALSNVLYEQTNGERVKRKGSSKQTVITYVTVWYIKTKGEVSHNSLE